MKRILCAVLCAFATIASAQDIVEFEIAKVIRTEPILKSGVRTTPKTVCNQTNGAYTSPCTVIYERDPYNIVTGYNVMVDYRGEIRTVRMTFDPGQAVHIKVVKRIYVIE